ncbi:UNVERIFIED_CONTAM: hypothetical protein Sradi_6854500 [Sesamum radiatum]|uniref:DUF4283 domain-containing protein n=1 Tax=Sesamum radiatum TaxID=300843 RepID=A0AAW2JL37_SESRA
MDSPKTLCSLSHTETHNSTHIQTSSQADDGDGEPVPDDELAVHEHIQSTFNMVDFMRLATKVVDEDDRDSMAILEALHKKWQGKFRHKDAPAELRLKPVAEHEVTNTFKQGFGPQNATESGVRDAFLKSSRKTLRFISPTKQRDEIIIRPTLRVMEQGSRRWRATAVGYFLGRKPYFPQLEAFAKSNWKGLKHTKIPVWIKFKHLPMEYWTEDGLSAVASGVGVPLYADKVTKACSRLDYARVCVMLDYSTVLPKHVVVISPILRDGKEVPTKVDIEYEWLPQKCRKCCSLGHSAANCPEEKRRSSVPITVFVRKEKSTGVDCSKGGEVASQVDEMAGEVDADGANNGGVARCPYKGDVSLQPTTHPHREDPAKSALPPQADGYGREVQQIHSGKGKEIVIYNSFEVLDRHSGEDEGYSQSHNHLNSGPNSLQPARCLPMISVSAWNSVRSHILPSWSWFDDYGGPGGRIWLAWDPTGVGIEILRVENQFIHCKATNKFTHTTCLISVIYGDCDMMLRRALWEGLQRIVEDAEDVPGSYWGTLMLSSTLVKCVAGQRTRVHLCLSFANLLQQQGLCTYHLRDVLTLGIIVVRGVGVCGNGLTVCVTQPPPFRFDNFLASQTGFLNSVASVWRHPIHGTKMYGVVSKLKNLKSVFRQRRKEKGDLASNVSLAKEFLEKAQALYEEHKRDILLLLVKCCRMVYCAAVKMEYMMLQQRAKLSWLKHGDQSSRVFFQKINSRRARQRVYQIHTPQGECITDMQRVTEEFISVFQNLLGGSRRQQNINLSWLRPDVKYLLSIEEGERLISSVTDEEIKEAFFDISEDSAPGHVCSYLQSNKEWLRGMQQILHLIIDQSQNAFVPGRSIADNILLAQELLAVTIKLNCHLGAP